MHGPDADGEKGSSTCEQYAAIPARRAPHARRKRKARISAQYRDRHRKRDEPGIVSFEHDRIGHPSPRAASSRRRVYRRGGGIDNQSVVAARRSQALAVIPAATWPRKRSRLCSVSAQASATSMPLVTKCFLKKSKCAWLSWNCCGVSTAENTGTSVLSCTSINALITVSATNSWR